MILDHVNLNHIRVFESVFRTGSMTNAAQELHLTQSGVSQHIKSLEEMLGVRLFDRIQQKLVPTSEGNLLYKGCSQGLTYIERALSSIKGGKEELAGTVSIGMPIEFGNNVVLPLLAELSKTYQRIQFRLQLDFASAMNDLLLKGELDFAFVDEFQMDRRITIDRVYDEILELCATEEFLKTRGTIKNTRSYFESLEYVEYQEDSPLLKMWFKHHLGHLGARHFDINVRTTVMDVQAVARLILADVGAGILPSHLVSKLDQEGQKLFSFKGCGKPLKNTISVAYLAERTHSPTTTTVLDLLKKALQSKAPITQSASK